MSASTTYQHPEVVFGTALKSLLGAKEWRVILPEEYDDHVRVYHNNTMADNAQHNHFSVDFNDELMESAGITHYSVNPEAAAFDARNYLLKRVTEETANPHFDFLRVTADYVKELRPEWDVRYIGEADAEDDWIIMDMSVDGVSHRGSFHDFSFTGRNYTDLGLTSSARWATVTERSETAYMEAVQRLIARVEKEAYEKAHPETVKKAPTKGFLRTLFAY